MTGYGPPDDPSEAPTGYYDYSGAAEGETTPAGSPWYRRPIFFLVVGLFVAILLGLAIYLIAEKTNGHGGGTTPTPTSPTTSIGTTTTSVTTSEPTTAPAAPAPTTTLTFAPTTTEPMATPPTTTTSIDGHHHHHHHDGGTP